MFDFGLYTRQIESSYNIKLNPDVIKHEFLNFLIENPIDKSMAVANKLEMYLDPMRHTTHLINEIESAIKSEVGFSFVRMGDGEGRFVGEAREEKYKALHEFSTIIAKRIWYGNSRCAPDRDFFDALEISYRDADLVGYSPPFRVNLEFRQIWYGYYGCVNGNNFITNNIKTNLPIRNWSHVGIICEGGLISVLRDVDVLVVTCHPPKLLEKSPLSSLNITVLNIPPEGSVGLVNSLADGVYMYPDLFLEIKDKIKSTPCKVVLCAAGVFAKLFCDIAKKSGKVGVDVGSELDKLLGFKTRG